MFNRFKLFFCLALMAITMSVSAFIPERNLLPRQDAKAQSTQYGYDSLNRLTNVTHEGVWKAAFKYDVNGNMVTQASPLASSSFSYDTMNRLSSSLISVNSRSFAVTNFYDLNGNRTNILYPGGLSVGYTYDAENRLSGLTTKYTNSTKTFVFGYDGASRLTNIVYPNTVISKFGYDAESRMTSYTHGFFLSHSITRDARGFKIRDDIYADSVPTFTNAIRQTRTHNDADQLLSAGSNEYSYDANGNLTNSVAGTYSWDYDNRMVNAGGTEYLYGSGARIGRIASGVTNYFVIDYTDGLKRPLAETDSTGNVTRYYVWAGFRLLAHIEADGVVRYYHSDELGSTLALTDEFGAATDQFAYSPYGELLSRTGTNNTVFLWLGSYGVFYDSTANLHLTLHRAYSAEQKRFISADPKGIDGGANLYAYGALNPLAFVDPYGLCADSGYQTPSWENYTPGLSSPRQTYQDYLNSPESQRDRDLTIGGPTTPIMAEFNANLYNNALLSYVGAAGSLAAKTGAGFADEAVTLTQQQASNLARFNKKLPAGNTGTAVDTLGDGVLFTSKVPGRVPGSSAVYQKSVDAAGNTSSYLKTTFDPKGNIIHIKDKLNGGVIPHQ